MRILDRSVYVGPSLYARFPVIRLELELGELEGWPTGRLGAPFVEALAAALPGLAEPRAVGVVAQFALQGALQSGGLFLDLL